MFESRLQKCVLLVVVGYKDMQWQLQSATGHSLCSWDSVKKKRKVKVTYIEPFSHVLHMTSVFASLAPREPIIEVTQSYT